MAATHVLDIYGVHLHLATRKRDWKKLRKRVTYLTEVPSSRGLTSFAIWHPNDTGPPVPVLTIWVDVKQHGDDFPDLLNTCAHEAAHGAGLILHWLEHDFRGNDGADEPHAYLVGWLTRWIYEGCGLTAPTTK